ncbi:MAG TPA: hypothetical protein VMB79_11450 [Jatrophihabitans sp.]|nr:hypothetical protein [Jatrophihabitans sp.]
METADVYNASIDDLFGNFRAALLALLPIAESARINYSDEEPHRDWERLAECMFDTFVRSPIGADESASYRPHPLARYDIDVEDYLAASWLTVDATAPCRGAVVRLLSRESLFDSVQLAEIDPVTLRTIRRRVVGLDGLNLAYFLRLENGISAVLTEIAAVE